METVLEVENKLFEYFSKNNIFNLEKDWLEVFTVTENENRAKALLLLGLDEFVKMNLIKELKYKEKGGEWVLLKPLSQYAQNVEIKASTSLAIARLINEYCEISKDTENICLSTNIIERDIQNIIVLCEKLLMSNLNNQEKE